MRRTALEVRYKQVDASMPRVICGQLDGRARTLTTAKSGGRTTVIGASPGLGQCERQVLLHFSSVDRHRDAVGADEGTDAPRDGDPDVAADRLIREQAADRVDDGCCRLVLREPSHGSWHGVRRDERRAEKREEDQRVGERGRPIDGLRGQSGLLRV